jgi:DNA-binding SARP family transcriptional activator
MTAPTNTTPPPAGPAPSGCERSKVDIHVGVLGPLHVDIGGHAVTITADRERTLVAALALTPGHPVPIWRLVDTIWDRRPPRHARNQIQGCVSRLRRRFAARIAQPLILTHHSGYILDVDPDAMDVTRFRRLRTRAQRAALAGDHLQVAYYFRAALGCWRGPALADVETALIRRVAVALDEERLQAVEACAAAELAAGASHELVPELTQLAAEHPYRQRLHATLMLALHRAGRDIEALALYQRTARRFVLELGAEPAQLRQLREAIARRNPRPLSQPNQARGVT